MNSTDRLLQNYARQVRLPWAPNIAGMQRVWFAVYPPVEERKIRARIQHFENFTRESGHGWALLDLTPIFPTWMGRHDYREAAFTEPEFFSCDDELEVLAAQTIRDFCATDGADENGVVALVGIASLFDFIKVARLIGRIEDSLRGRLLVFFPGEYRQNVYRFMDARDGFNYMAVPITSSENFLLA
jgi:hypothetical protein